MSQSKLKKCVAAFNANPSIQGAMAVESQAKQCFDDGVIDESVCEQIVFKIGQYRRSRSPLVGYKVLVAKHERFTALSMWNVVAVLEDGYEAAENRSGSVSGTVEEARVFAVEELTRLGYKPILS